MLSALDACKVKWQEVGMTRSYFFFFLIWEGNIVQLLNIPSAPESIKWPPEGFPAEALGSILGQENRFPRAATKDHTCLQLRSWAA